MNVSEITLALQDIENKPSKEGRKACSDLLAQNAPPTGTATRKDMVQFLNAVAEFCRDAQLQAVVKLAQLSVYYGSNSPHFPRLEINRIVFDLVRRILEPRLVDQASFGLCGPAAFTVTLAKSQPALYVQLAVDLLIGGKATVKFLNIEPNESIRDFPPPRKMSPADWLILASVRNSDILLDDDTWAKYGGSHPKLMFDWLCQAGFPTVVCLPTGNMGKGLPLQAMWGPVVGWLGAVAMQDYHPKKPNILDAYTDSQLRDPATNLEIACLLARNKWRVLIQINEKVTGETSDIDPVKRAKIAGKEMSELTGQPFTPEMQEAARNKAIAQLVGDGGATHWVVAKQITIGGDLKVRVVRYSWGAKKQTAPIARDIFLQVYGGFVAACELNADNT